ncbi:hypothetical protein OPV22_011558 [Ensete ventricosum]|uniref:ADP/ATP translocase n=1 Tax=Ensete ventricosum TaxID=4639 RepID=A0AAV8RJW0_ENSVE|nr:hypothetical protein OPV22_011558 [Ensete ventricosum]
MKGLCRYWRGNTANVIRYFPTQDSFFPSFALLNGTGLASDHILTVRRIMMMTSGEAVKYKSSLDVFSQILKNEGPSSLVQGCSCSSSERSMALAVLKDNQISQAMITGLFRLNNNNCQKKEGYKESYSS